VALIAAVLLTAIWLLPRSEPVNGTPVAAETILPTTGASKITIRRVGPATAASVSDDDAVAGVLADVNAFWTLTMPSAFHRPFVPLTGGYVSIDSTAPTGSAWCVSSPDQIAGNAYYCPSGDAIVYDSAGLVPVLLGHYGVAGLTASFAHEFGHAIQARIGPTTAERSAHPTLYPSILIEAQGDCFAGSFLAWAVGGHTTNVRLPASSLVRAVAPRLDFRDPVSVPVGDPTAHGLSLDRLTAILRGYRGGATACHALTRAEMSPTLGRPGLVSKRSPDRYASTSATLAAARTSIAAFASTLPVAGTSGLAATRPAQVDLTAAAPYGQFADAATLALATGRALTGTPEGAACFTGAWTASVFGHVPPGGLGSWAGDADEALDMLRARPAATFDELAGYADGFASGWSACTDQ
jgi:predicted metalloprotease